MNLISNNGVLHDNQSDDKLCNRALVVGEEASEIFIAVNRTDLHEMNSESCTGERRFNSP